tara:strand:- start:93 stop:407 length:315 start_codon:yes stop_codon:yes gene_type:complete
MEAVWSDNVPSQTSASPKVIPVNSPFKGRRAIQGQVGTIWHFKNIGHMSRRRDVKNCYGLLSTLKYVENRRVEASCVEDWGFTRLEPYLVQMIVVPGLLYEIDE